MWLSIQGHPGDLDVLLTSNSAVLIPFSDSYSLEWVSYLKRCLRITGLHEIQFLIYDPFFFLGNTPFCLDSVHNKLWRYNGNTAIQENFLSAVLYTAFA